jgi:quercetin dioxygenase-like cupin family protein
MKTSSQWAALAIATLGLLASGSAAPDGAAVHVVFSYVLPKLQGGQLKATVVEVGYGPGGSSAAHSHPCPVIGYVLEGALRTQVAGEPEAVYKAGESFYEAPNGVHAISANASATQPVKFLAYFVCDHDTPLTVAPPKDSQTGGK